MVKLLQVCLAVCFAATFVEASPQLGVDFGGLLAGALSLGATSAPATCSQADINHSDTTMITSLETFERIVYFFHSVDENLAALVGGFEKAAIECYSIQNGNLTGTLTLCQRGNATQADVTFAASKDGTFKVYGFPTRTSVGELIDYDCGNNCILSKYCVNPTSPNASVTSFYFVTCRNTLVPADIIKKCKERVKNPAFKWIDLNPQLSCGCASKSPYVLPVIYT